ncbi:hypothetical protein C5167_013993, partial [Papaver somniferum]
MATMEITNPPPGEGGVSVSVEKINPRNRFELIDPQIQHEFIKNLNLISTNRYLINAIDYVAYADEIKEGLKRCVVQFYSNL